MKLPQDGINLKISVFENLLFISIQSSSTYVSIIIGIVAMVV